MQIYGPSHVHGSTPVKGPAGSRAASGASRPQGADEVQISAAGDAAAEAADGAVRADLVARVREQIANGTYENAEKLDAAIENLLDALA